MPDANRNLMTVFAEALKRTDPAARAAYLDIACRDDAALRQRVEALLAAHEGAGRFLEPESCAMSETTSPETEGAPRAAVPKTRPSSDLVNEEQRPEAATTTMADPARPTAPSGRLRARSSLAGIGYSTFSAREGWERSTGPIRPSRSSGRWRSS